jgi:hypothetical protein
MKNATTTHSLKNQVRKTKDGRQYRVIKFSTSFFINNCTTWLIEYIENGKQFYKPEILILKDKLLKG